MGEMVFLFIVVLVIQAVIAAYMSEVAKQKGYESGAFLICLFLGIFGCLYVISLPDKVLREQNNQIIKLLSEINVPSNISQSSLSDELPDL